MHVLQVIPELDTGGAERTTLDVARALIDAGHRASVVTARGRLIDPLRQLGAAVHILPVDRKAPWVWAVTARRLRQIMRDQKVDIVHARSRACAWPALWAARAAGVPFVTTYHGIYNGRSAAKRFYNGVMARGDVVIANSAFTADHLIRIHGTDPGRVVVIPRGVDLAQFSPDAVSADRVAALRRAWGVGDDAGWIILCPARLTRWKGQSLLIEALAQVPPPFTALLVGSAQGRDGYVAELTAAIAAAGLADRVRLVGHCADMAAAYSLADVVVCPSLQPEAFGRTAAEAQALQRLVIASAHGGACEVIDDGVTGWLVPPGDATALTKALDVARTVSLNTSQCMTASGRQRVEAHFSLQSMTSATLAVYSTLLRG